MSSMTDFTADIIQFYKDVIAALVALSSLM